jgi:hypothetical protein
VNSTPDLLFTEAFSTAAIEEFEENALYVYPEAQFETLIFIVRESLLLSFTYSVMLLGAVPKLGDVDAALAEIVTKVNIDTIRITVIKMLVILFI